MIDNFDLRQLVAPLQEWFGQNARVLPWRDHPSAYNVWVSEIMLQQTRVEAVKPYFARFTRELPDVKMLAECDEEKLLKLWEGLGYYNRVRNMKIAALQIMEEHGGVIPSDYNALLKLKGIGSYTAGAIASIAYGKPYPAVDGNVLRVLSRVTADDSDIAKQSVKKVMEDRLFDIMNDVQVDVNPSIFNQALMELGATVCLPNQAPKCTICPWKELCLARKEGKELALPVKSKAKARRVEEKTVLIIKAGEQLALHRRANKGLLAGLYELPNVEGHLTSQEAVAFVKKKGYEPIRIQELEEAKHIFSHIEWHMKGYIVFLSEWSVAEDDWEFVEVTDVVEKYAIPSAFVRYTQYLNLVLGKDAIEDIV